MLYLQNTVISSKFIAKFMAKSTLEALDINEAFIVDAWHERFALYKQTKKEINAANETAHYLTMVGKSAFMLLKDLAYPEDIAKKTVAELHALLKGHLQPVNFEITERSKFHSIVRHTDERLRDYLLRIQKQAAKCNFTDLETQLRDRIVAGVNHSEVQKKMLSKKTLTYAEAKQIVQLHDDVNNALDEKTGVMFVKQKSKYWKTGENRHNNSTKRYPQNNSINTGTSNVHKEGLGQCFSCGAHHLRKTCKFRNVTCNTCHKQGHIARVCRSKVSVRTVNAEFDNNSNHESEVQVLSVKGSQHIHEEITFTNGKVRKFIVDTGSPISFMSLSELRTIHADVKLKPTTTSICGVTGNNLRVLGKCNFNVSSRGHTANVTFLVTQTGPSVLGLDGLQLLSVKVVLPCTTQMSSNIRELIHKCSQNTGGMRIPPTHLHVSGDPIPYSHGVERKRPATYMWRLSYHSEPTSKANSHN